MTFFKTMTYKTFFEFKKNQDPQTIGLFQGYASIFDHIDTQNDRVVRGAFQKSLGHWKALKGKPKMLWQHCEDQIIGVWHTVEEDSKGLFVEGKLLLEVAKAKEVYALLKEGALDGLSIGYQVKQSLKASSPNGVRLLTELDLLEISLVTFPANEQARISAVKNS